MSIKTRVEKLEAGRTTHAEVTLGELVLYSYSDVVDLEFGCRLQHSKLGRLIAATVAGAGLSANNGKGALDGTRL
jgi:hypothetical protein